MSAAAAPLVRAALEEDVGTGDLTTSWTVPAADRSRARVVAKRPLVVAGGDAFTAVWRALDPSIEVEMERADGAPAAAGDVVAVVRGPTRALLEGERAAMNFLAHLSGIATLTRAFVTAVAATDARILDTRKTTPGWRVLEKAAVRAGGGANHRFGLWDMVLIKENHARAAGGLTAAVQAARQRAREAGVEVEVEVRSLEELEEVLPLGVDRVLLDNFDITGLRAAVARVRAHDGARPRLEASGNVTLERVAAIAATGVDDISVGALTHSAPAADLSFLLE